jgi:hypothetical protein
VGQSRRGHQQPRHLARRARLSRIPGKLAVVVDDGSDALAAATGAALQRLGVVVRAIPAPELALVRLDLDAHHAAVDGRRVGALLFRARPRANFGAGFGERDESFSSSEARAAWLAVTALPSVAVVNRLDPETWFTFSEWPTWRRRMARGRVPVARLAAGGAELGGEAHWFPWGGGVAAVPPPLVRRAFGAAVVAATELRRATWCYGSVVAGTSSYTARMAGRVLESFGVHLAEIVTAEDGSFVSCTAHPAVPRQATATTAARIARALDAHLRRR